MLAVIRARFPNTPASSVWPDAAMQAWLDPGHPFSLAHFMTRASFFQLDMRYVLFPPVMVEDKRGDESLGASPRERLVRGVLDEVSRMSNPDWDLVDQFLICFAGVVDMFGGGTYALKTRPGSNRRTIGGAVIDSASPFDAICQEVGHGFGFSHELDAAGGEYGCPYSPMSAMGQGSSFTRPVDASLPVGMRPGSDSPYNGWTDDVQRIIGPYIPAVHFYASNTQFVHPDSVYRVPASYENSPHTFRLDAIDKGVSAWPRRRRVLAVLPSVNQGDDLFLEIRRPVDYDAGLVRDATDASGIPAAVVIYSWSKATSRITYLDSIPFVRASGDRDFHSYRHHIGVRLNGFDEDLGAASLTVGGGDFWKHFGVDIEVRENVETLSTTGWQTVRTAACFIDGEKEYRCRMLMKRTQLVLQASSFGFEKPYYQWFVADQMLDPADSSIELNLQVRRARDGRWQEPQNETIRIDYRLVEGRLRLTTCAPVAGIRLPVRVAVSESETGLLLNAYPDQAAWTSVRIDNVVIEWDENYQTDLARCWKRFSGTRFQQQRAFALPTPEPDPRIRDITLETVLAQLVDTNPAVANAVISEVSRLAGSTRLEVLKRLYR